MKVVEIKQDLNDTSFEQEIFDISKLSRHIISMLDIAEEIRKTFKRYIVREFDENNNKIDPFINTDIVETSVPTLSKYDFKHKRYIMNIRGYCNNTLDSFEQLKQDKIEFIRNGSLEKI